MAYRMAASAPARGRPGRAVARTAAYSTDERYEIGLLLLPVLIVAFVIALGHAMKPGARLGDLMARGGGRDIVAVKVGSPPVASKAAPPTRAELIRGQPLVPVQEAAGPALGAGAVPPPAAARLAGSSSTLEVGTARGPFEFMAPSLPGSAQQDAGRSRIAVAALPVPVVPAIREPSAVLAPPLTSVPAREQIPVPPQTELVALEPEPAQPGAANVCAAPDGLLQARGRMPASLPPLASTDPAELGLKLAEAARDQARDLVIYNDKYRRISYPMGDVSPLFGVCTDVVIRAYRAVGLDLQALVQQTRVGSGDTSIDHRRTETLRRFFALHGQSLPVSAFAEDYRPGDIVTYHRPQNSRSRSHIAIVAAETGPSGQPMIIHNRGWGVQIEDGLFVDRITGHYRFSGLKGRPGPAIAATEAGSVSSGPTRTGPLRPIRRLVHPVGTGTPPSTADVVVQAVARPRSLSPASCRANAGVACPPRPAVGASPSPQRKAANAISSQRQQ